MNMPPKGGLQWDCASLIQVDEITEISHFLRICLTSFPHKSFDSSAIWLPILAKAVHCVMMSDESESVSDLVDLLMELTDFEIPELEI